MLSTFPGLVARTIVRRPGVWLVSLLGLLVLLAWGSSRTTFGLDATNLLPEETLTQDGLPRDILQELSSTNQVAVFLEAEKTLEPTEVQAIFEFLAPKLAAIDGIQRLHAKLTPAEARFVDEFLPRNVMLYLSPAALRIASGRLVRDSIEAALLQEGGLARSPFSAGLIQRGDDPLGFIVVAARALRQWRGVSRVRLVEGLFALPGEKAFFLTLESDVGLDDIAATRSLIRSIEEVLAHARDDVSVGPLLLSKQLFVVGRSVSFLSAYDTLYRDVVRIGVAATMVVTFLLVLFFRRPLAPLVLIAPVAMGLLAAAAGAAFLFESVSLIAWVLIGLMIGLGVDFGIHIAVHYWLYGATRDGREAALVSALARPGRGIVLGGLTSAAAFLALWVFPYPVMHQVAWMTAFGLVAILAASFTVLPLLLSFSRPDVRREPVWTRWIVVFQMGRVRPLVALLPWFLLVVAAAVAVPSLPFEPHPWKLVVRGNPESAKIDRLSQLMGTSFTPILIVSRGSTAEEALERDREAVTRLQRVALRAGIANIQTLARWLPSRAQQRANIDWVDEHPALFSADRFRRDFEATIARMNDPAPYLTNEYLPLVTASLNTELTEVSLEDLRVMGLGPDIDRHLFQRAEEHIAVSYVFLQRYPWADGAMPDFLAAVRAEGLNDLPGVTLAGAPLRATNPDVIRRALITATGLALLFAGGLLWWQFRRLSVVGLCLVPLVCGLSAAVLVMRLLGIELNMLSLTIAPILVGIGIDDGIHMVGRLGTGQDLDTVLRETGSSMTMTTLTTVGALACMVVATFTGLRELGLVGAVGLLVCLGASLHLIPLGWRWLGPDRALPGSDWDRQAD